GAVRAGGGGAGAHAGAAGPARARPTGGDRACARAVPGARRHVALIGAPRFSTSLALAQAPPLRPSGGGCLTAGIASPTTLLFSAFSRTGAEETMARTRSGDGASEILTRLSSEQRQAAIDEASGSIARKILVEHKRRTIGELVRALERHKQWS